MFRNDFMEEKEFEEKAKEEQQVANILKADPDQKDAKENPTEEQIQKLFFGILKKGRRDICLPPFLCYEIRIGMDYPSASPLMFSSTRIRPQYSQTMIFLRIRISN